MLLAVAELLSLFRRLLGLALSVQVRIVGE
jgi:hypothetical protein